MQTIVLATQKVAPARARLPLASHLRPLQAGHTVRLIETDSQGTLSNWQSRRPYAEPIVEPVYAAGDVEARLQSLDRDGVTLTIIDTSGGVSAATASAIRYADLCLIPARPSVADIEATASTLSVVRAWNKPFAFILNQTPIRGQRLGNARDRARRRSRARSRRRRRPALHRDAQRSPGRAERGSCGQRIRTRQQIGRRNPRPLAMGRGQAECRHGRSRKSFSSENCRKHPFPRPSSKPLQKRRRSPSDHPIGPAPTMASARFFSRESARRGVCRAGAITSGTSGTRRSSGRSGRSAARCRRNRAVWHFSPSRS